MKNFLISLKELKVRVYLQSILLIIASSFVSGCIKFSNYPMNVKQVGDIDKNNKNITLLNNTYYTPNLISSLAEHGFKVKPNPIKYHEINDVGRNKVISFNQSSARYGLTLYTHETSMKCVFSGNAMIEATLTITDLNTGDVVLILRQKGADGPCPPIPPIWDGLASALASKWN